MLAVALCLACSLLPGPALAKDKLVAGSIDFGQDAATSAGEFQDVSDLASPDAESAPSSDAPQGKDALPATEVGVTAPVVVFPYVPNPTTEAFIASIAEPARKIGQDEGLYASVMIAQAILESGSGSSGLSKPPYNNLFGIKGSYKGSSVVMLTSEDNGSGYKYDIAAGFRRYPSVTESLQDYADLLKRDMGSFYAPAWKANARTYVEACNYLQGHYATDTSYSGKLQGLIAAYDLERYDHPADWVHSAQAQAQKALSLLSAAMSGSQGATAATATVASSPSATSDSTAAGAAAREAENPLGDPGVQVSLLAFGGLVALFSKNEIALLVAAIKNLVFA